MLLILVFITAYRNNVFESRKCQYIKFVLWNYNDACIINLIV